MRMKPEEFDALVRATCPKCAAGHKPTQRLSTGEWTHTQQTGNAFMSVICMASFLRNSEFAPVAEPPAPQVPAAEPPRG